MKKRNPNRTMQAWIDARQRHHLSDAQVQMARELGMNPAKLGKLDNHGQEPWKMPLGEYIQQVYLKRFGRPRPDGVMSIEDRLRAERRKREGKGRGPASARRGDTMTRYDIDGGIPTLAAAVLRHICHGGPPARETS
jgi:hypothetical protein